MKVAVLRAAVYITLATASLLAAHYWFGGSDVALLSFFVVGAFAVEMAAQRHSCRARYAVYLAAVAGLAASGTVLVGQAMHVRQEVRSQRAVGRRLAGAVNESARTVALATNDRNVVVAISGGLLRKIGYDRAEVLNQPVTRLVPGFDPDQVKADVARLHADGHDGWLVRENRVMKFVDRGGRMVEVPMTVIACRLSVDRIVERDVLFLMLAEETR